MVLPAMVYVGALARPAADSPLVEPLFQAQS